MIENPEIVKLDQLKNVFRIKKQLKKKAFTRTKAPSTIEAWLIPTVKSARLVKKLIHDNDSSAEKI